MPFILLFLTALTFADAIDMRGLIDKTFTRDNTYCRFGSKRVEIQIRSESQYTEPKEAGYGEHILYYPRTEAELLPLNQERLHNYSFFKGEGGLCSKSLGFMLDPQTMAVLFLRENRPFKNKLSFILFNTKSMGPRKVVDTEFLTDEAEFSPDGFIFRAYSERNTGEMGRVQIGDTQYVYQDRQFSYWVKYSQDTFEPLKSHSFKKFRWSKHFKDEKDFLKLAGWNEKDKSFSNQVLYLAVNHKLKKKCVLLAADKIKLDGKEAGWRCR